jgi:hypothetical protein
VDLTEQVIRLWESQPLLYDEYVGVAEDNVRLDPDNPPAKDCVRLKEQNQDLLNALQVSRRPRGCVET